MQQSSQRTPPQGRGRAPARWTVWEIALVMLSVLMIAFPLYAGTMSWIMPPAAQGFVPQQRFTSTATNEVPTTPTTPTTVTPTTETPTTVTPNPPSAWTSASRSARR